MKKQNILLLAGASILIPLASFAISSPTNVFVRQERTPSDVSLFWTNPTDLDFSHIELRHSTGSHPLTINDGDFLTSGTNTNYWHAGVISGMNYYSIFAVDLSGNVSDPTTGAVNVDQEGPLFSQPTVTTGIVLGPGGVIAEWSVSDPGYVYSLSYKIIDMQTSGVLINNMADFSLEISHTASLGLDKAFIDAGGTGGDYMFEYTAIDDYGNLTTKQVFFTYDPENILDSTGPNVISLSPASGAVVPGIVDFIRELTDDTIDGSSIQIRISGDPFLYGLAYINTIFPSDPSTDPQTHTQSVGGLRDQLRYRGSTITDYLGNQTITEPMPFIVDGTAPTITYTSPIEDGGYILLGETAVLSAEAYDTHLVGGHMHFLIGNTPDFYATRPDGGLYHGGNEPYDTTSQGGINVPNLPVGTYYRYAEASDVVDNYVSGAIQTFTVVEEIPEEETPRRSGGGGGSMSKDTCASDISPSFYDGLCFDNKGVPVTYRQKILKLYKSDATPSDTDEYVTIAGFIKDIFALLDIPLRGTMPESYNTTPINEKLLNKVIKKLVKLQK